MHYTLRTPLFRSFKFGSFALIAFFFFTNLTDFSITRAIAPTVYAEAFVASEDFIPADVPSSGDHELDLIIFHAGERHGVDPRLLHAVIWQESKYKPEAESGVGAQGLMQLMPGTAKRYKCANANDPAANVEAGTKYLRWLLKRFKGDVTLALAGYNAGEGNVDKNNGVPPFPETQNYVRVITGRYGKTYHPVMTPDEARLAFHLTPELTVQDEE
jgi:soluble lytic murein transglycosylase-like protein